MIEEEMWTNGEINPTKRREEEFSRCELSCWDLCLFIPMSCSWILSGSSCFFFCSCSSCVLAYLDCSTIWGVCTVVCWLFPLLGFCTGLLLVVDGVAGAGGGSFSNGTLGSSNAGCDGIAEFWVLPFRLIRGASASTSASTRNGVTVA